MTNGSAAATPAGAGTYEWLTVANLIVIAIFAVVVVVAILWGSRLKSQRKAAEIELREGATIDTGDRRIDDASATGAAAVTPVATSGPAEVPPADPEPASGPYVTPEPAVPPPPLADTPVVATAPFDAAPATVAADLATPPADPAPAGDDLTRMKGVGPKLASRLGELGITRFEQIAGLSPGEADSLDAELGAFRGRLARDRWIEQAGYLARDDRAGFEAAFGKL